MSTISRTQTNSTDTSMIQDQGYGAELAALAALGPGEAAVAQACIALDEQEVQANRLREASRRAEIEAAQKRIKEMRDEASSKLIAGVIEGVSQMGASVAGTSSKACSEAIGGAGKGLSAAMEFDASLSKQASEEYGLLEKQAANQTEELGKDAERAARLSEKAMSHVEQIAEARAQARLAAARG